MVTGLVLGTPLVVVRPGVSDEQPPAPQLTLLPVPLPPLQAGSGDQAAPAPPVPGFPSEPGRGPAQVPSAAPLPSAPSRPQTPGGTVQPGAGATAEDGTRQGAGRSDPRRAHVRAERLPRPEPAARARGFPASRHPVRSEWPDHSAHQRARRPPVAGIAQPPQWHEYSGLSQGRRLNHRQFRESHAPGPSQIRDEAR